MQRVVCRRGLSLVASAAALLVACVVPLAPNAQANNAVCSKVVVGAVLSLTSEHSAGGIHLRNGYEYARKRLDEAGGVPVRGRCHSLRIIYYDDESSAGRAAQLTERLIVRDRVRFLLGPYGLAKTAAVANVAARHHIPLISVSGLPQRLEAGIDPKFFFPLVRASSGVLAAVPDYVSRLARELARAPEDIRLALLFDTTRVDEEARAALRARARKHGMEIIVDQAFGRASGDLVQGLAKVKSERPEVLMIDAHPGAANRALKQLREMQLDLPVLAMADCADARLIARNKEKAENVLCISSWRQPVAAHDGLFGSAESFTRDYVAHNEAQGPAKKLEAVAASAAHAAVAVRVLAAAMVRANSLDHFQVRDALAGIDLETIIGQVSFAKPSAVMHGKPVFRQVMDGKYVTVWPEARATAAYRWPGTSPRPF